MNEPTDSRAKAPGVEPALRRRSPGDIIEIDEVERLGVRPSTGEVIRKRAWSVLVPTILGMLIDGADVIAPPLFQLSFPLGCLAGFVYSGFLNVSPTWRIGITLATGLYIVLPFTGMLPLATIVAAVAQIFDPKALKEEPFSS